MAENRKLKTTSGTQKSVCDEACKAFAKMVCSCDGVAPRTLHLFNDLPLPRTFGDMKSLKENCLKIYDEEKVKIEQHLKRLDGKINLSVEMLMHNWDRYICLTACFIDEDWNLKKWVLKYRNEDINFTFIRHLQKALEDWEIEGKIFTICLKTITFSDSVDRMVEKVKDQVQKKKTLELGGQLFHVRCCAELFRVIAEDAFKVISDIIDTVMLLTWSKSERMWHLTLFKLKNVLEYRSTDDFTEDVRGYEVPSADEWKKLECVCKLMEAVDTAANSLFLTKSASANVFLGILLELRARLTREASNLDTFGQTVAQKIIEKLDKYWNDMFLVLAVATVMDPRCKMKYIEYISTKLEGGGSDSKVSTVLDAIHTLYNGYKVPPQDLCSSSGSPPKSDLDSYLEDSVLPWSEDFNLLDWWRDASVAYPTVSRMARDLLSISFSVLTSYDAYYEEERMIPLDVRGIGQAWIEALMCTRSWAAKPEEPEDSEDEDEDF